MHHISADHRRAGIADGQPWVGGLSQVRDVTCLGLTTSHWPMWSRPDDLAEVLSGLARSVS